MMSSSGSRASRPVLVEPWLGKRRMEMRWELEHRREEEDAVLLVRHHRALSLLPCVITSCSSCLQCASRTGAHCVDVPVDPCLHGMYQQKE
uniref:Uncharacterized protein n=1 Tax=Arundo donax TaxID=35708 RepID=A0A0A9TUL2_ARUDO